MSDETPQRREADKKIEELVGRVDRLAEQHAVLSGKLDENNAATARIEASTAGLVEAWTAIAGGIKVLGWLATAAKYIGMFAAAVGSVVGAYYAFRNGHITPDIPKGQ